MRSREYNMKSRLLCVLILLIFAMGCKDEKKKKDDDDKESTEQSTQGGEAAGGEEAGGEEAGDSAPPASATCADVYANMLKINGSEGAPSKDEFVANCEKESTPKQRECLVKAKSETDFGPCFLLGKAPALDPNAPPGKLDAKAIGLDSQLAEELEKAEAEFKEEMDKAEKDFDVEMKKIQKELEAIR